MLEERCFGVGLLGQDLSPPAGAPVELWAVSCRAHLEDEWEVKSFQLVSKRTTWQLLTYTPPSRDTNEQVCGGNGACAALGSQPLTPWRNSRGSCCHLIWIILSEALFKGAGLSEAESSTISRVKRKEGLGPLQTPNQASPISILTQNYGKPPLSQQASFTPNNGSPGPAC